jgi:hypothetical protein
MKKLLAAAALALVMATPAFADNDKYMTGNKYANMCPTTEAPKPPANAKGKSATEDYVDKIFYWNQCLGYVLGYYDAVAAWQDVSEDTAPVCTPSGVTAQQMHEVLLKFIKANPQSRQEPLTHLALMAYAQAWPCQKQPQATKRGA